MSFLGTSLGLVNSSRWRNSSCLDEGNKLQTPQPGRTNRNTHMRHRQNMVYII
jgi:hypothetical protein